MLAQKKEQKDPKVDKSSQNNQIFESTKNKMVWARDMKV
jgi:hypothetical protein